MARQKGFKPRKVTRGGRSTWRQYAYEIFFGSSAMAAENVRDAILENKASIDAVVAGNSGLTVLSSTLVDMKTATDTDLYTVPVGKTLVLVSIVVRKATASLASGNDYDIGEIGVLNWKSGLDFSGVTDDNKMHQTWSTGITEVYAAGKVIGIDVNTGSALAANATVELIGYLV